jgi:putative Holliday junction resolvase
MIGLDPGEARIGVAVSDPTGTLCTPLEAIRRTEDGQDLNRIAELARREQAVRIVVGLPVTMEGRRGTQAKAALRFCEALRAVTSVPVTTWDERLTSVEARARLREAGRRLGRDRGAIDSAAAALMLEAYLSAYRRQKRAASPHTR